MGVCVLMLDPQEVRHLAGNHPAFHSILSYVSSYLIVFAFVPVMSGAFSYIN